MKSLIMKNLYIALIAIGVGLILTGIYFYPQLEGKTVYQMDIAKNRGMTQELMKYREIDKVNNIFWTNRMFGGMPTTLMTTFYVENIFYYLNKLFMLFLPRSSGFLFLYFIGFFIFLRMLKYDLWISILGAIAFALSTYFIIIIEAGHNSKANAIGYIPPLVGSILLTYRGKYIAGGLLTALFGGLHIFAYHYQITYYVLFLIFFIVLGEFIAATQARQLNVFFKASLTLIIAALLAFGPNFNMFYSAYVYSKDTIRGKNELTFNKEQSSDGGLDKDYITAWSYGVQETLSLMIPNIKGGSSSEQIGKHKNALENVDVRFKNLVAQWSSYWGEQPFTSGPTYVGAFIVFLFVLSIFIVRNVQVWTLLGITILSIMLAWGKNFMPLTDWFIDNFPMYNKFRTVSTFLIIPEFTIPFIAMMGLKKIFDEPELLLKYKKYFYVALSLTAGVAFIFWVAPSMFVSSYISSNDQMQFSEFLKQGATQQQVDEFASNLEIAREAILKSDAMRSFIFIILGATILYVGAWALRKRKKIDKRIFIALIFIIVLADLIPINKRYLNEKNFVPKAKMEKPFVPTPADVYILNDKEPNFRVLNLTVNTFNDASTSFFHNSIGGYHAAKLQRYQDLIEHKIQKEMAKLIGVLQKNPTDTSINNVLKTLYVLNMLNTKYIIYNTSSAPLINPFRYGHAWAVDTVIFAENADEEMTLLMQTNTATTAIVRKEQQKLFENLKINQNKNVKVELTSYHPEKLKYNYSSKDSSFVVFSEIFHNNWFAKVDNKEVPIIRCNYVLRGLILPPGEHKIEFYYIPQAFKTGYKVSLAFSIILGLLFLGFITYTFKENSRLKKS